MTMSILPIGTVVRLTGDGGYIMICGRVVVGEDANGNDVVYEYAGCSFPVGVVDSNYFMFDGEDIEEIIFVGFQDERELEYKEALIQATKNVNSEEVI